jgi:16S rRNA (uracil1498-N3)-methyltransferase
VNLGADEAKHLREVLRLRVGDDAYVFDGEGHEFFCNVIESRRESAALKVVEEVKPARPESPFHLTLAVALLKGEKFDLVVQKATELGVVQVLPMKTTHADIRLRDDADTSKRVARWQRIALEAAKQSGRAVVPTVSSPGDFATLIKDRPAGFLFSERDGDSLLEAKEKVGAKLSELTVLVGSEGGWSNQELDIARDAGWAIITLGGRTLRAETAAIAVATLLEHLFGDLK